jgi:hypothetical protein
MKYIFTLFLVFIFAFDSYCQKKIDTTIQQNSKTSVPDYFTIIKGGPPPIVNLKKNKIKCYGKNKNRVNCTLYTRSITGLCKYHEPKFSPPIIVADQEVLEEHEIEEYSSNTDYEYIIGAPIKIDNLEVAQHDFPNLMKWNDAIKACTALGKGWRLPNKDELIILYQNIDKIGGFMKEEYWSSTEYDDDIGGAWYHGFGNGNQFGSSKDNTFYIRAVRTIK